MKLLSFLLLSIPLFVLGQNPTIGLQEMSGQESDGYVLYSPEKSTNVYLIDKCGMKINSWSFSERPGATVYLLENGNLLRAGKDSLEIRSWDNTLIWSYAMNINGYAQHHDIEPLPNGNILCLLSDIRPDIEMIAEGRDPNNVNSTFKLDRIIELEPVGTNGANLVWDWYFVDHLIQDFDSTKNNFGVISDHPELLDLNFDNGQDNDYTHCNAIDYNASLDQVMLTSRHMGEIYIIDHSTTITEAANHSGGESGKGGDFLFRWGNPQVYGQGTAIDQKISGPHDGKWVEDGYADEGKISIFNNGGDGSLSFSSIHLLTPEMTGSEYNMNGNTYLPSDFEWSWNGEVQGVIAYETKKSGCHSLPNGNFMMCENSLGRLSEIGKDGTVHWVYINPEATTLFNQFDSPSNNTLFRGEQYPVDYPGLSGQDLTPQGLVEDQNTVSEACSNGTSGITLRSIQDLHLVNPIYNGSLTFGTSISDANVKVFNGIGQCVFSVDSFNGITLNTGLSSGVFLVMIEIDSNTYSGKIVFVN